MSCVRQLRRLVAASLVLLGLVTGGACAQGFKFAQPTEDDKVEKAAGEARQARIADDLATPCRADLKGKKIMVVIGQTGPTGTIGAQQQNFGPHFQAINTRLRALGLRTYTAEEIKAQVAQAEIDAYFRNDPDAALAASKRLGANFVLRGLIGAESAMNVVIPVNQVSVSMGFTLTGPNGRTLSTADAHSSSFAGADVRRMALTLVNEQADEVVARLYADYCRNAGTNAAPARKKK